MTVQILPAQERTVLKQCAQFLANGNPPVRQPQGPEAKRESGRIDRVGLLNSTGTAPFLLERDD